MDVDILTPKMPFENNVKVNKRPRSPDSPSPVERASKRTLVGTRDTFTQLSWNNPNTRLPSIKLNMVDVFSAPRDEDWVHQTQGLRLHSPALSSDEQKRLSGDGNVDVDDMDVQMNEATHSYHKSIENHRQDCIPPTTSSYTTTPGSHSTSDWSDYMLSTPRHNNNNNNPPNITIHPATPASTHHRRQTTDSMVISPSTTSSSTITSPPLSAFSSSTTSSNMSCISQISDTSQMSSTTTHPSHPPSSTYQSSSNSHVRPSGSGAPKRRQQLSMGPRTDCEKCRMKVPGHWMHF